MASTSPTPTTALYKGSCHCGFVTYTVELDFANPAPEWHRAGATKCNCSICHKAGYLLAEPAAEGSFTLLSPPEGEGALSDYAFGAGGVRHPFCPRCGVRCYIRGAIRFWGVEYPVMKVNILTLDSRVDGKPMDDLRDVRIRYWNAGGEVKPGDPASEPFEGGAR